MSKSDNLLPSDYGSLLIAVKERVRTAQYAALKAVNTELVGLYWDIGKMIVERQSDAKHGLAIAEQLASDLRSEFPGIAGFSRRNVFYMREFFLSYRDDAKVQPLVAQIAWSHNLVIMSKCKDPQEREFYLRMTRKFGWSKSVLIHQIENQSFEKSLLGQTNFGGVHTGAAGTGQTGGEGRIHFRFPGTGRGTQRAGAGARVDREDREFSAGDGWHVCLHGQSVSAGGGWGGVFH